MMRVAGEGVHGQRIRALVVILWRAWLRSHEALTLAETDLEPRRGSILVRHGKGGKRREVGMDDWGWEHVEPWRQHRATLPVGPFLCVLRGQRADADGPRPAPAPTRRLAAIAGVRRRFAPHQLRHAHAVEMAREGVPLPVIQRQLGHAHLGVTSTLPTRHRHSRDHRDDPRPPTTNDLSQRRPPTLKEKRRSEGPQALRAACVSMSRRAGRRSERKRGQP